MAEILTLFSDDSEENKSEIRIDYKRGVKNLIDNAPNLKKLPSAFVLNLERNPLSVNHAEIPVIDLCGINGPDECRISTVKAISSACSLWGFFRIVNHGVKTALMAEMLDLVEEFFNLSVEEKMKYASDDVMSPIRYGTSLNSSLTHTLHWRDYFRHYGHPFEHTFHLWPHNPAKYREVTKEYLKEIRQLAMNLVGAISEGLGLERGYIEKSMGDQGCQILAANYYPPCPEPDKTLGLAPHSDHGALTILMQNDVNIGLQVKHNQTWIAVPNVPGTFVVNLGDYLEILSNGKYKSVEHRAVVNAEKTRISVAVGHGPDLSMVIGPASSLVDDSDESQYRPVTYKDYMRTQQSSTIRGKSSLQSLRTKITAQERSG